MSGSTANPLIPQGTLNRIRGNIQVVSFPVLNITASYLGSEGFSFSRTSPATTMIDQMTGRVVSPEPYQSVNIEIHLNRAQGLAAQWEAQLVALSYLGDLTVYSDSANLTTYHFTNCSIENVSPIAVTGKTSDYSITLTGVYIINNNLWNLTI